MIENGLPSIAVPQLRELLDIFDRIDQCNDVCPSPLVRLRTTLRDVVCAAEIVDEMIRQHSESNTRFLNKAISQHMQRLISEKNDSSKNPIDTQYSTAWMERHTTASKALFFFARAFFDSAYRQLLVLQGDSAGEPSMNQIVNSERNTVRELLDQRDPTFVRWFKSFRELRDDVKFGKPHLNSAVFGSNGDLDTVIHFDSVSGAREITHEYLREVVQQSLFIAEIVYDELVKSNIYQLKGPLIRTPSEGAP